MKNYSIKLKHPDGSSDTYFCDKYKYDYGFTHMTSKVKLVLEDKITLIIGSMTTVEIIKEKK